MVDAKRCLFEGGAETTVGLDPRVFGAKVNVDLMHRAVRSQLLSRRQGTSSTKTRGEVSGGGRKPWRQKGTGRARAGSRRSPVWVGGGTVFGPKPRSYDVRLTKKMRWRALTAALSDRANEGRVIVLDRVGFDAPKTKAAVELLGRLGIEGSALIVVGRDEMARAAKKSFSNLENVKCIASGGLNVYDVIRHATLVLTEAAVREIEERA